MYNVYVGKFKSAEDSKPALLKLNQNGYKGRCYNLGDFFSLRICSFGAYMDAYACLSKLLDKGFRAFIHNK